MLDLPVPEEAPRALRATARRMAAAAVPVQMTATADELTPRLLLAALAEPPYDQLRETYRLLAGTYGGGPIDHEIECVELAIEDLQRVAENLRRTLADEEPDHEADETFMLHAGFRRAG